MGERKLVLLLWLISLFVGSINVVHISVCWFCGLKSNSTFFSVGMEPPLPI